ncbi:MAG: hypothetical protein R2875_07740 [Desulfobacterales bacterium]
MKHILMPCIFIFLLTGCMMEPYEQAFDKNAGPYPEHYLEIITGFLDQYLENPESIKNLTVIKPPEKITVEHHQESISLTKGNEVWESFITFDARNRNGKTVRDFHVVWIRNNRIMAFDYKKPDLAYRFEHRFSPDAEDETEPVPENTIAE